MPETLNREAKTLTRTARRLLRSHLLSLIGDCEELIDLLNANNPNDDERIGEDLEEIQGDADDLVATFNRFRTGRAL